MLAIMHFNGLGRFSNVALLGSFVSLETVEGVWYIFPVVIKS